MMTANDRAAIIQLRPPSPMSDNQNTAEPQKPRRRWFQFRLRTLLIAVALKTVPLVLWPAHSAIIH
jgi:hypothetical protein